MSNPKFFVFVSSFAALLAFTAAASHSPHWYHPVPVRSDAVGEDAHPPQGTPVKYDCPSEGKFQSSNCSHYIYCAPDLTATLVACPACQIEDSAMCPGGWFHFSQEKGDCVWPVDARCGTKPTTTTTTTTPDPTECVPECQQEGECLCYDTCLPDNSSSIGGRWQKVWCDEVGGLQLYWNPDTVLWPHGGSCDFWENLSPAVQEHYQNMNPEECPTPLLHCYWRPDKDCDNKFFWLPEGSKNKGEEKHMTCGRQPESGEWLWWSQDALTCVIECPKGAGQCKAC